MRILIVDDNVDASHTLAMLLRQSGHEAATAQKGSIKLSNGVLTSSFLHISMPRLSGYDVAREIRNRSELQRTTLVAVTGWGQVPDRARAEEAGFDYHLTKPVNYRLL